MSDAFEDQARILAHSIPHAEISICSDLRSPQVTEPHILLEAADMIESMGNRQRWLETRATEAEAKSALLEQTIQNGAEMIRGLTARVEAAEAKDATWRLAYLVSVDEPQPGRKIVAINDDGSGAMMFWVHDEGLIEAEGDDCTFDWFKGNFIWWAYIPDSVEFWCETRADDPMTLKRLPAEFPSDGTCVRCGAAPRNASGLCATCVDEDAERAGEVENEASQELWRKTLDQERVVASGDLCWGCPPTGYPTDKTRCEPCPRRSENDGLEECGNWSATDPAALSSSRKQGG